MIDDDEIAWLLLQILRDTRTYIGAKFACGSLDGAAQIKYAKALFLALPKSEQLEVEDLFDTIYSSVVATRLAACHATHQAPKAMQ